MKKRSFVFTVVLLVSLSAGAQTAPGTPSCEKTLGVRWADITQCMKELHARYGGAYKGEGYVEQFPGAVFGYLPDGTNTPVISAVGEDYQAYNDTDPTNDPIVWMASVTKPFTHASALIAIERGGLDYDGLWQNLPYTGAKTNLVDNDPYPSSQALKKTIRVRDVLTMTAGFADTTVYEINNSSFRGTAAPFFGADSASCRQSTSGTTDTTKQFYEEPGLNDECIFLPASNSWVGGRSVRNLPIANFLMRLPVHHGHIAGTTLFPLAYSNRSSIMAAWLAQMQSGQLPNHHVDDNIFKPLGMNDTFYIPYPASGYDSDASEAQTGRIAHMKNMANGLRGSITPPLGVRPCGGSYWCDQRPWPNPWMEGGLYSTPKDVFKFLAALRDNTLTTFSATTRNRLLTDQLQPQQHGSGGQSRTAGFFYARNGVGGLVNGLTEGTVGHNGFSGTAMFYDPLRRTGWFFANQRVMQQKHYFQTSPEQFAEVRIFQRMLNSLLENVRPDNLDFHFDALRATHRGLYPMRYASAVPPADTTDAYTGCAFSETVCQYTMQNEFHDDQSTARTWHDLSNNNRTMNVVTAAARPWPGNGSRYVAPASGRLGPFRLALASHGDYATVEVPTAPTAFTMNVWVRPRTTANNTIVTRTVFHPAGEVPTWQIAVENGRIVANLWDTGGKRTVIGGAVAADTWYHVVAKATQGGQLSLYVNGRAAGTPVAVGTFPAANIPTYTLGYYTVSAPGFDVAAVNVYNQEHALADITRNCNGLKYRFPGMTCQ